MMRRVNRSRHALIWLPALVLGATVAQLAVATFVPGIERFDDKAFGARLAAYPAMMLLVPAIWWLAVKRRRPDAAPPYVAFALIMLGFLVDTTGNSLDFYDSIVWWDDMNHFVNWFFLLSGIGLIIARDLEPRWAQVLLVAGLGCLLALGWELGEWYTFIRHGTELDTAYEDTLADMTLGSFGAFLAALVVARVASRQ
jgi:drug/metabolite transporter superfamily protein YnfA